MTPKEKAFELYNKFKKIFLDANSDSWSKESKQCALIEVDEIINLLSTLNKPEYTAFIVGDAYTILETEYEGHVHGYELIEYWQQVKEEVNKL